MHSPDNLRQDGLRWKSENATIIMFTRNSKTHRLFRLYTSEPGLSVHQDQEPLLLRLTMESGHHARSHQHLWALGKQIETPASRCQVALD